MIGPISRILLRYVVGYLVIRALIPQDIADQIANDPDIAAAIGFAIAAVVEGFYALAKKRGWRT
ncbi:conserved hypothetical protein [Afipia carboxidovorans OM5]|uniref:Uncharacterized protein n=1 Tax=Afipia carboxidovorans (strain ATCC 49405 / DSM 1227 / KCTC 32145 / OM5) TaxID=504832 RepID=B6JEG7_AFIC5|nr:hypothetical protein [Afipia carboxidovorans]ACI92732.1 conserved hypothetical protein [Afipia carboxidovorans OM5]AEI03516.1 hypothetical protein OCA4_c23960 [Afipia carboxidovorans OM4]AEI07093.1 hypothetical protein OCA5_c23970 [Afipia carboxidovorans OM5]BEV44668.1 hypothetical protein CRBSH125_08510 [Afipia carboxidovorans]